MSDNTTTDLLKSLEAAYSKQDFDSALNILLNNSQSFSRGLYHYDLGVIYLKKQDLAVARYHFEKAIKNQFAHTAVLSNLNHTVSTLGYYRLEEATSWSEGIAKTFLSTPSSWFLTGSLFLLVVILLIAKTKIKKLFHWSLILILIFSPLAIQLYFTKNLKLGIALKAVETYEGPSQVFPQSHLIPAGVKLVIEESEMKHEGWGFIKYPLGISGWAKLDNIGIL